MSQAAPTITVQFAPFRLRLMRDTGGVWIASLFHAGTAEAIVSISSTPLQPATDPAVRVVDGHPRLCIGGAVLPLPTRQLRRVADWLDGDASPSAPAAIVDMRTEPPHVTPLDEVATDAGNQLNPDDVVAHG